MAASVSPGTIKSLSLIAPALNGEDSAVGPKLDLSNETLGPVKKITFIGNWTRKSSVETIGYQGTTPISYPRIVCDYWNDVFEIQTSYIGSDDEDAGWMTIGSFRSWPTYGTELSYPHYQELTVNSCSRYLRIRRIGASQDFPLYYSSGPMPPPIIKVEAPSEGSYREIYPMGMPAGAGRGTVYDVRDCGNTKVFTGAGGNIVYPDRRPRVVEIQASMDGVTSWYTIASFQNYAVAVIEGAHNFISAYCALPASGPFAQVSMFKTCEVVELAPEATTTITHNQGKVPTVLALKAVGTSWADATGCVDITHSWDSNQVTVKNTTAYTMTFKIRIL